jgi:hypothetical protein
LLQVFKNPNGSRKKTWEVRDKAVSLLPRPTPRSPQKPPKGTNMSVFMLQNILEGLWLEELCTFPKKQSLFIYSKNFFGKTRV